MSNVIDAVFKLTDNFSAPMSKIMGSLNEASSAGKKTRRNLDTIGKGLTKTGDTLTKSVTLPIVGLAVAGVKTAADFEKSMSNVRAVADASDEEFSDLTETAKLLGRTTLYTATEVADGMTEVAKAGWSAEDITVGMEGILNAAMASGESIEDIATITANAITSFKGLNGEMGLTAGDAQKVADILTYAANATTTDVMEIGNAFQYVAPSAASMGFNIEETTTAIAAMASAGIEGSVAGTTLKSTLTNLVKPKVQKTLEELGVEVTDQKGNFLSLNEIIGNMREGFSDLTQEEKLYYAYSIAGKTGQSGLLQLLSYSSDAYNELSDAMYAAGGTSENTAKIMGDNLEGKILLFKSALEGLAIEITEDILPKLTELVDKGTELVTAFTEMDPEQQDMILKWVAFAAALGPVLSILGKIVSFASAVGGLVANLSMIGGAAGGAAAATAGAGAAAGAGTAAGGAGAAAAGAATGFSALLGPLLLIVGVVALVIARFDEFKQTIQSVKDNYAAWKEQFADTTGIGTFGAAIQHLSESVAPVISFLGAVISGFADLVVSVFDGLLNSQGFTMFISGLESILSGVIDVFASVIEFLTDFITGDWNAAWDDLAGVVEGAIEIIVGLVEGVAGILGSLASGVKGVAEWASDKWNQYVVGDTEGNASGTNNFAGGLTRINEQGGEIVNLPSGTQIIPHDLARNQIGNSYGSTVTITGNTFTVREDADIDRITDALVRKMYRAQANMGMA